jgi:hypothetical protein
MIGAWALQAALDLRDPPVQSSISSTLAPT